MSDCALAITSAKEWGMQMPRRWLTRFGGCLQHNAESRTEYAEYRQQRARINSMIRTTRNVDND